VEFVVLCFRGLAFAEQPGSVCEKKATKHKAETIKGTKDHEGKKQGLVVFRAGGLGAAAGAGIGWSKWHEGNLVPGQPEKVTLLAITAVL
jgi:hypothetical protein